MTKWKILRSHTWFAADGHPAFAHFKYKKVEVDAAGNDTEVISWGYRHPVAKAGRCPEHRDSIARSGWCFKKPAIAKELMWCMPEVLTALESGATIYWCAGEKDADAFNAVFEEVATSVHQGEGKGGATPEQFQIFAGCENNIVLFADRDKTGYCDVLDRYDGLLRVGIAPEQVQIWAPRRGYNDVAAQLAIANISFVNVTGKLAKLRKYVTRVRRKSRAQERGEAARNEGGEAGNGKAGGGRTGDGKSGGVIKKSAAEQKLAKFCEALRNAGCVQGTGEDWTCPHPAHDDHRPSFGVTIGANGGLLLNCQSAGCMPALDETAAHKAWRGAILDVLGLRESDIRPPLKAGRGRARADEETVAQALVRVAREEYRLGVDNSGKVFAVRHDGANLARYFHKGTSEFAESLCALFMRQTGRVAGTTPLADAMRVLADDARQSTPEEVGLRVAHVPGPDKEIAIDMGDVAGRVIIVGPAGWSIAAKSPVLFRRSKITLPYPEPKRGGDLTDLRKLLNVSDADWDLIVAWLIAAFIPDIPHAIAMLNGRQGTGKSDATRMLVSLLDPTDVPLRKRPKDEQEWSVAANASWVVPLENMSYIPEWLSDDMCRAVTGDGVLERQLYSNSEVEARKFQRVMILNGIEASGIRGDLADRMFTIQLAKIAATSRLTEEEITAKFAALRPRLFGAILDLLSETLQVMLSGKHVIDNRALPRMADFALVLRAVDCVRRTDSFTHYCELQRRTIANIGSDSPITGAVRKLLREQPQQRWRGTTTQLYDALEAYADIRSKAWPGSASVLGKELIRLSPSWEELGMQIQDVRAKGLRRWKIWLHSPVNLC